MQMIRLTESASQQLSVHYNGQFAQLPYCYAVTAQEFAQGVWGAAEELRATATLTEECLLAAVVDDQISGYVHLFCQHNAAEGEQPEQTYGAIKFFSFLPTQRQVGVALLAEAERYFQRLGLTHIRAFGGLTYRFYRFDFAPLSGAASHIGALLGQQGYVQSDAWLLMHRPALAAPEPIGLEPSLRLQYEQPQRHGIQFERIELWRGEKRIGRCVAHRLSEMHQAPAAHTTFYVRGLDVDEAERGRGLGRVLMQAMHAHMAGLGQQCAVLYTNRDNFRAQLLYSSLGYQTIDTAYSWEKTLTGATSEP